MNPSPTRSIRMKVPSGLISQVQKLAEAGWFRDIGEIVLDALHRFLEAHREELMEDFICQDIDWGLAGRACR